MSDKLILPSADVMYANAMARSAEIKREVAREINGRACGVKRIAAALDLAVLKPTATLEDVRAACELVERYAIKSVCVTTSLVSFATLYTERVAAVIGFPHGNACPAAKVMEAMLAMEAGATELDVVINYGRFLDGDSAPVANELVPIIHSAHERCVTVKAILETCYYTPDQIADACRLCVDLGVDFVKTSTGFGPQGATAGMVKIMLDVLQGRCQVKASGGINTYADACQYLDMGCTRIGSSKFAELLP